jgi:putative transposase
MPKLSKLMDGAEHEVLSYMDFPRAHWLQIHSTNPLERLNAEIKRRTNVVGIFPNDAAITRLVGAMRGRNLRLIDARPLAYVSMVASGPPS